MPTCSYVNGPGNDGIGATLTSTGTDPLIIQGDTLTIGQTVAVFGQANKAHNGLYVLTQQGNGVAPWVLTRSSNFNSTNTILANSVIGITGGDYVGKFYSVNAGIGEVTVGTTEIEVVPFADSGVYAFDTLTFSATGITAPPLITIVTPQPFQLNGDLIGNSGVWISTLTLAGTISNATFTNLVGIAGNLNQTITGTVSYPALKVSQGGGSQLSANSATTLSIPLLEIVSGSFSFASTTLTAIDAPSLRLVGVAMSFNTNSSLTSISLPVIEYIYGNLSVNNGTASLTNLSLGSSLKYLGGNVTITTATLNQTSVDGILVACGIVTGKQIGRAHV